MRDARPRRRWTLTRQIALERPARPAVPACCPRCAGTFVYTDEDGDWICFVCNELVVCWSRYRFLMRRWDGNTAARAENGYGHRGRAA